LVSPKPCREALACQQPRWELHLDELQIGAQTSGNAAVPNFTYAGVGPASLAHSGAATGREKIKGSWWPTINYEEMDGFRQWSGEADDEA
jgi:hypothetical protein